MGGLLNADQFTGVFYVLEADFSKTMVRSSDICVLRKQFAIRRLSHIIFCPETRAVGTTRNLLEDYAENMRAQIFYLLWLSHCIGQHCHHFREYCVCVCVFACVRVCERLVRCMCVWCVCI